MQRLSVALALGALGGANAAYFRAKTANPVAQVVTLLKELETKVKDEGNTEQKAYDKYACWCEDTLGRKATEIADGKEQIDSLQQSIIKMGGEVASHSIEVEQLKKDIAANVDSQRQANAVREKDAEAYAAERIESEQCIGALEAAVKVLAGAGSKKSAATLQEAQLLSVVAGVRSVLGRSKPSVSGDELEIVRRFVDHPDQFVGGSTGFLSATQISNNPFGDYAPQSSQVSGILKTMYESFVASLEKANAEEAKAQGSFEKLMETKEAELKTLEATLQQTEGDEASKTKQHADDKELLDDTKKQLEIDEEFFQQTKTSCKTKAEEWAERTRLRSEELSGIAKAIEILGDPENNKVFENATSTFVQLGSQRNRGSDARREAYQKIASVATRVQSLRLARLAVEVKTGGHFNKILATIDKMVELLREEAKEDVAHKSRCEKSLEKNKLDTEDLEHEIKKGNKTIDRLKSEASALQDIVTEAEMQINATQGEMDEARQLRGEEMDGVVQALKDDADAIALIEEAIAALGKFYDRQKDDEEVLVQVSQPDDSADKPPETFKGEYKGNTGESRGVIAILEMIKEDLQKEMQKSRGDDSAAQVMYKKSMDKMTESLQSQTSKKTAAEKDIAALEFKIADLEQEVDAKSADLDGEKKLKESLDTDCAWIDTHFESRKTKREAEIEGLQEAKMYLSGVDAGEQA